ncbi:hypothetical protein ANCCAN_21404 [Ancylostoma caninum]|uniref:Uncharacterized protein n=1 Tax=Ancylostoma caninum TaxID=29170 RepID=A0A368FKW3_ANCCA|nr:hypothetical protein ANCCAN_21404 [Ancylostoma caninum]
MYAETPNPVWELCRVERYMREVSELPLLPYRGIVGAVNQGPDKNVNYITSRDFPHDVRFFSGKTEDGVSTSSLLGHEVIFHGYKEGPLKKFYVLGNVEVIGNDVPKIYESFFSVDLMVEHIGCTDDQGVSLVWSDRWEFITDSFGLFKNREHGVYKVEAIRHYKPNEFPRWKVKKILNIVDSYVVEQKRASTPHSTKPPCHSMKQPSEGTISKRSSPCHSVKQHSGGGTSKRGLCDEEDDSDGKRNDSGVYSEELQDCKSPRRPNGEKCRPITTDRVNGDLGCHSSIDEQAERELHDHMHRCLASIKVRAAMKQANPKLFEDLVKALMHV